MIKKNLVAFSLALALTFPVASEGLVATAATSTSVSESYSSSTYSVNPVRTVGNGNNFVVLAWEKHPQADSYIIEQYKNNAWVKVGTQNSTTVLTYTVSGLSQGTTYKFRIKACDNVNGKTVYFSSDTHTTATTPANVTGFKATAYTNSCKLTWNKPTGATGYIIEQYKDGKWTQIKQITSASTVSYTVGSLASGTTYKFRITPYRSAGGVNYKSLTSSTLTTSTLPSKATLKESTLTENSIKLSWNKISGATGYYVEQYKDGKWTQIKQITNASTVSYTVGSLKSGTTYQFRVQPYKTLNGVTYKGTVSSVLTTTTLPAKVEVQNDITKTLYSESIYITPVNGADGYILEENINGVWKEVEIEITTSETYDDENSEVTYYNLHTLTRESGASHIYRVRAYKELNDKRYYGAYTSAIRSAERCYDSDILNITENRITWNESSTADGYFLNIYCENSGISVVEDITDNKITSYDFDFPVNDTARITLTPYVECFGEKLTKSLNDVEFTYSKNNGETVYRINEDVEFGAFCYEGGLSALDIKLFSCLYLDGCYDSYTEKFIGAEGGTANYSGTGKFIDLWWTDEYTLELYQYDINDIFTYNGKQYKIEGYVTNLQDFWSEEGSFGCGVYHCYTTSIEYKYTENGIEATAVGKKSYGSDEIELNLKITSVN